MPEFRSGVTRNLLMEHSVLYSFDCVPKGRGVPEEEVLADIRKAFEETYAEIHEVLEHCTLDELEEFLMKRIE